jgi:hypothetical protein
VFLRGYNGSRGRWLKLEDCVWSRTILRTKHALMNTLNQYRSLFRDTLDVPNVTLKMLVQGLIGTSGAPWEDNITYSKDLLLDISRKRETDNELRPLQGAKCWPCRLRTGEAAFCAVGDFYVNDRQNLFDVFKESQTFLDLDFEDSRRVTDLLRKLGCVSFLSEQVTVNTEAHQPLQIDHGLSQNYQRRADALNRYVTPFQPGVGIRLLSTEDRLTVAQVLRALRVSFYVSPSAPVGEREGLDKSEHRNALPPSTKRIVTADIYCNKGRGRLLRTSQQHKRGHGACFRDLPLFGQKEAGLCTSD